jgi:hypothetical protein
MGTTVEGEIDRPYLRDDGGTSPAITAHDGCQSLKRTLASCRPVPTSDVPTSLAGSVKAAIHTFLNRRNTPYRGGLRRHGDFSPPVALRPATNVVVRAQF